MFNHQINSFIAFAGVLAFGIGASYIIITFANNGDPYFAATNASAIRGEL